MPKGTENAPTGSEDDRFRQVSDELERCKAQMENMGYQLNCVMRDQGLEKACQDVGRWLKEIAVPLQSMASTYTFSEGEAEAIAELRASLARPSFDALEMNLGRTPFSSSQVGVATVQQGAAK